MKVGVIFFVVIIFGASAQTWVRIARLSNFNAYFTESMQHVVNELENNGWCNLKIQDQTVVVNEQMYKWHVSGNVTYANGFLVSIQKIDLTNVQDVFGSPVVNGTTQATGAVRGQINFRDADIGFDVIFKPQDGAEQRYTGIFSYRLISFRATITKNYHTQEMSTLLEIIDLNPASVRMVFLPENNITEVLSRRTFVASSIRPSVVAWGRDIIQPILQQLVTKTQFPSFCFGNC